MEQENKKITKIVISSEDELTDVVTGILESPNERIVLTFAEESDLLISPINLKVIQETSDDEKILSKRKNTYRSNPNFGSRTFCRIWLIDD